MELNTQTVWIEKDVKEGLPEEKGTYFVIRHGKRYFSYFDKEDNKFYDHGVTHYLIPLTEQQMKERDEKIASDAWKAALQWNDFKHHEHNPHPDKSQYIQSIIK